MQLTSTQFSALTAALLDGYSATTLAQMVRLTFELPLERITRPGPLDQVVSELVGWAERTDKVAALLAGASAHNPANRAIQSLAAQAEAEAWFANPPLVTALPAAAPAIPQQRPPRVEHFLDRRQALADLLAALQPGAVVTLCGPGGIGKTALAAEAIWQLPEARFPHGILIYSFYGQGQIDRACEHIARTLGEELKPNPRAAALRALAGRQLLLFLDGAEEADDLPVLLALRGSCGVLVTTRRRSDALAVRQDVDPLPLADAIALLQAWGGQRAADEAAAAAIAELVGRLPLALRLVGRYLAEHEENAAEYLAWLQETPLAALNHGQRREQSVPVLLERSLAQVSKTARQVMEVVGVLAIAPFDAKLLASALTPVTPAPRPGWASRLINWFARAKPQLSIDSSNLRHVFGELVNYGLLVRPDEFYIVSHTLIHTYVRNRLAPSDVIIDRLAAQYTSVIEAQAPDFALLHTLRPHIVTLLSTCIVRRLWSPVRSLAWTIEEYLDLQGYWADRLNVISAALTAAQAQYDHCNEGTWLGKFGRAYSDLGQTATAIEYYQQALVIAQEIGDRRSEGNHLGNLGRAYADLGQVETAISYCQQALVIAQEIGDRRSEGNHLGNIGVAYHFSKQEVETAITYYQQALVIAQEIGDRRSEGNHLGNMGSAYLDLGQVEQAIGYYQQALVISREIGHRRNDGNHLSNMGRAYYKLGQVTTAIEYYQQALTISREIGDRRGEGADLSNLGYAHDSLKQVEQAIGYHQQALAIFRDIGDRRFEVTLLGRLGNAFYSLGQMECAIDYYQQSLVIAQEIGDRRAEGRYLGNLGRSSSALGRMKTAIVYHQQALAIAKAIGDRHNEGNWLGNLGQFYAALGQMQEAIECYQQALAIAKAIGDRHHEGNWLGNLGLAYLALDQVKEAIECYQQALAIAKAIGDHHGEGNRWGNLGNAYYTLEQVEGAINSYQQALAIAQQIGDRRGEGIRLANLGRVYGSQGDFSRACELWTAALAIFEEIRSPNAERVRRWIARLEESREDKE